MVKEKNKVAKIEDFAREVKAQGLEVNVCLIASSSSNLTSTKVGGIAVLAAGKIDKNYTGTSQKLLDDSKTCFYESRISHLAREGYDEKLTITELRKDPKLNDYLRYLNEQEITYDFLYFEE